MAFNPSILKEYDIRGIVDQTLFEKDAYWIGRCFGHLTRESGGSAIAVGEDVRVSSPQLSSALIQGLCEAGLDVYSLGVVPTPMLYFAEYTLPVQSAVMVTGSHNPPAHNGFKMSFQRKPFFGKDIQFFSDLIQKKLCEGKGSIYETNLMSQYIERIFQGLNFERELTVAWDPCHGATVDVLNNIIQKLPGKHVLLNAKMDGTFPSHPPDPSDPKNLVQLQEAVLTNKCDLGIAFDGDGDRLAAIDGQGNILWGDQLLLLFACDLMKREPHASIIADIKTSQGFFDKIKSLGGNALMWKTGHSHIKAKMAESGALLAGEVSGHFFFKENYYGFDDGIYAALRLVHYLCHSSESLAEIYEDFPLLYSTPELRISCPSERKFEIPNNIKSRLLSQGYSFNDIDGIRVQLDEGWWLLRASNTQDVLVARCESYTKQGLENVSQHFKDELKHENVEISLEGNA
ncbi:MAG: phosphomannomutase/phosphoglucomutase [Alphaproteobacteria bacterium]|nr:phosphomannomutase/phosphoglucomutase [Alphaproteobacteria bacterium]